jgi:hypothetical protein
VSRAPLDLVQMTRVLDRLHGRVLLLPGDGTIAVPSAAF